VFIRSISLKNFRCYKNQVLYFGETANKVLDIASGDVGSGKTSLFNAIGWCLFGKETSTLLGEPDPALGIPNAGTMQGDGPHEVSVELVIGGAGESGDGQIIAKRYKKYKGHFAISPDLNGEFELSIYENDDIRQFYGIDAEERLKEFFSGEFLEFYMFDGEYLAKGENIKGKNIDLAFKRMFKISALKLLSKSLREQSREFGKKRGNAGKLQQLQETYRLENDEQEQKIKDKDGLGEQIQNLKQDLEQSKATLESLRAIYEGIKKAKEIIDKRSELQEESDKLKKEREDARTGFWQSLIDKDYLELLRDIVQDSAGLVHDEGKKADLPPYIKRPFLDSIIEKQTCICGRPLAEGSSEMYRVKALREEQSPGPYESQISELYVVLSRIASDHGPGKEIEAASIRFREKIEKVNQVENQINRYSEESDELSAEQKDTLLQYESTQNKIKYINDTLEPKEKKLHLLEDDIKRKEEEIREIDSQIKHQASKDEEAKIAQKEKDIADIANEIVDDVASRLSFDFVKRLEGKLNSLIPEFNILSGIEAKIEIGAAKDLMVNISDSYLDPEKSYLSGGQNQAINILLIAAFSQALSEVSLSVPFIVMDHPFSNLSEERKIELIEKFGAMFKNTRVLMLMPPGDFDISKAKKIIDTTWFISNCKEKKECKAEKVVT